MNKNFLIVILTFLGVYVFFPNLFNRASRDVNRYGSRWGKRIYNGGSYVKRGYQKRRASSKARRSMKQMSKRRKTN